MYRYCEQRGGKMELVKIIAITFPLYFIGMSVGDYYIEKCIRIGMLIRFSIYRYIETALIFTSGFILANSLNGG